MEVSVYGDLIFDTPFLIILISCACADPNFNIDIALYWGAVAGTRAAKAAAHRADPETAHWAHHSNTGITANHTTLDGHSFAVHRRL